MLNPSIGKLLGKYESRYALVNAVSRKAREIAEENEESLIKTTEKAVDIAMDQMAGDKFTIENIG